MTATALKEQALDLPDLNFFIQELTAEMANERINRKRFYEWITEDHKAEFINGHIILQSPVKARHLEASNGLFLPLGAYVKKHKLGKVYVEKAMISLTRNDYEPDICFFRSEQAQHFKEDTMLFPAPDFVVEILSKSTEKIDRGIKKRDYAIHRIPEYWIIDPLKKTIEQYLLDPRNEENTYADPIIYQITDTIKSLMIEGFEMPLSDIFE